MTKSSYARVKEKRGGERSAVLVKTKKTDCRGRKEKEIETKRREQKLANALTLVLAEGCVDLVDILGTGLGIGLVGGVDVDVGC